MRIATTSAVHRSRATSDFFPREAETLKLAAHRRTADLDARPDLQRDAQLCKSRVWPRSHQLDEQLLLLGRDPSRDSAAMRLGLDRPRLSRETKRSIHGRSSHAEALGELLVSQPFLCAGLDNADSKSTEIAVGMFRKSTRAFSRKPAHPCPEGA
nr:hypothetical protein [Nannocystis exedens]